MTVASAVNHLLIREVRKYSRTISVSGLKLCQFCMHVGSISYRYINVALWEIFCAILAVTCLHLSILKNKFGYAYI